MKNIFKASIVFAASVLAVGCNDAKYNPDLLESHAYFVESTNAVSTPGKTFTIMMDEEYTSFPLTVGLTKPVDKDVIYKVVVDEEVLKQYAKDQGTDYMLLAEDLYDLGENKITVPAGSLSAEPINIKLMQIPEKLKGTPLALPLRLESVEGGVPVMSKTSAFVAVSAAEARYELAYFDGNTFLNTGTFETAKQFPNFTIEVRFQIDNFGREGAGGYGRNRDVFSNGNKVLCRFEDPQTTNESDPRHSQIQFQADGFQNPKVGTHFELNKWQHYAVTYDGTNITMYYNGVDAGVGAGSKAHTPASIGNCLFNYFSWMGGSAGDAGHGTGTTVHWGKCKILLTEARVWSVCRTPEQIANNIKTVSAMSEGLEGYWKINKTSMSEKDGMFVFDDLSGNGNALKTPYKIEHWIEVSSEDTATKWPEGI